MDRLAMLRKMVADKPDQPFAAYGLAMELVKLDKMGEASSVFADLVTGHPSYVASYLMYGNLLAKQGDRTQAIAIYDQGIVVARTAGDAHTEGELESAKAELT